MRRLLIFALIAVLLFVGYQYYQRNSSGLASSSRVVAPKLNISQTPLDLKRVTSVLGSATSTALDTGKSFLNNVTDGQAEPLINKTLENLQNEVKDLPREQYEKVKYEFCQDVIVKYEEEQ